MSSQPTFFDLNRVFTEDWKTFLVDNYDQPFTISCVEGEVTMLGSWLTVNLIMCMPLLKRGHPISREKHLYLSGIYGGNVHQKILTEVSRTLEDAGYTREQLCEDIESTVMEMHNLQYTHTAGFVRTMDLKDIADTILQPGAREICTPDYGDIDDLQIKRMEEAFQSQSKRMIELLSGDTLPFNAFRAPLVCGALKLGQFAQFVFSAGPRSDTDDAMFNKPVVGSFLSGMRDAHDLAFESRSASKAAHMNKSHMSITQYGNRKNHLLVSSLEKLYPGDCGSNTYMTFHPTSKNVALFSGKFYLDANNQLTELTKDRYQDVVGKSVMFRDVITCRWTDGYCETCGGTITRSFSRNGNVGFTANVNTGAPVAQQVLSTKHLITTDAAVYVIPEALEGFMVAKTNDIYLRVDVHKFKNTLALGFLARDVERLNDLRYIVTENELHAAYFTDIKFMSIGMLDQNGNIRKHITRTKMGGDSKSYPHLSPEILEVIRNHPEDIVEQDKMKWLLLRNVDLKSPIMQCSVVNNSIKRFVKRFSDLITREITRFKSANDFHKTLTDLIWSRVPSHATHVSTLIRACMVTSKTNFEIPVVENPDNVMFGALPKIIPMRSFGAQAAFERYNLVTNSPVCYITPKLHGPLDEFMCYSDTIERDKHWPVTTGEPVRLAPVNHSH